MLKPRPVILTPLASRAWLAKETYLTMTLQFISASVQKLFSSSLPRSELKRVRSGGGGVNVFRSSVRS